MSDPPSIPVISLPPPLELNQIASNSTNNAFLNTNEQSIEAKLVESPRRSEVMKDQDSIIAFYPPFQLLSYRFPPYLL